MSCCRLFSSYCNHAIPGCHPPAPAVDLQPRSSSRASRPPRSAPNPATLARFFGVRVSIHRTRLRGVQPRGVASWPVSHRSATESTATGSECKADRCPRASTRARQCSCRAAGNLVKVQKSLRIAATKKGHSPVEADGRSRTPCAGCPRIERVHPVENIWQRQPCCVKGVVCH